MKDFKLKEGHYLAVVKDNESESLFTVIVINEDDEGFTCMLNENYQDYLELNYSDAVPFDSVVFKQTQTQTQTQTFQQATAQNILSGEVKDYYIKADHLTMKEGFDALHNGDLFVEFES